LNIDIIQGSTVTGPLTWLIRGNIDINAKLINHIKEEEYIPRQLELFLDRMEPAPKPKPFKYDGKEVTIDIGISLNNLSASVPVNAPEISYLVNALTRPIVAYMNTNYTKIPLNFTIGMGENLFNGALFPGDAELFTYISASVYKELASLVRETKKTKNIKTLLWHGVGGINRGVKYMFNYITDYFWRLHF